MYNNNIKSENCQGETPEDEVKKKFEPKKSMSLMLADSYDRLGLDNRAFRVRECGTFLEFAKEINLSDNSNKKNFKLHNANFCRDRLCPMCSWRRSYKIFGQVSQIMDVISDKYSFLFLTLTVPNCLPDCLPKLIDNMQKGWQHLIHYKRFKDAVRGYFKALEVTSNCMANTYHPHYHVILAVNKRYFKGTQYIKRDEWLSMWQKAMNDYSITQVDIRRCKNKTDIKDGNNAVKALSSAVAEVAKYSVKTDDYLFTDNLYTDEHVRTLLLSLINRRLCSFGGCFDKVRKQLQLDDVMDGDLIHIDNISLRSDVALQIYRYAWSCGAYKLIEVSKKINVDIECEE